MTNFEQQHLGEQRARLKLPTQFHQARFTPRSCRTIVMCAGDVSLHGSTLLFKRNNP